MLGRNGRRVAVGVAAALATAGAASIALGAIPADDGKIYACYSNGDGTVRVQADPTKPCAKNWTALNWDASQAKVPQTSTYWERKVIDVPANSFKEVRVACHDGDLATGGGYEGPTGGPSMDTFTATSSLPDPAAGPDAVDHIPTGWWATMENSGNSAIGATVYVVCVHIE